MSYLKDDRIADMNNNGALRNTIISDKNSIRIYITLSNAKKIYGCYLCDGAIEDAESSCTSVMVIEGGTL